MGVLRTSILQEIDALDGTEMVDDEVTPPQTENNDKYPKFVKAANLDLPPPPPPTTEEEGSELVLEEPIGKN